MWKYSIIVAAVLSLVLSQTIAAKDLDASQLLDRYAENLEKRQSFIIRSEINCKNNSLYSQPEFRKRSGPSKQRFVEEFRFDGYRCNVRTRSWSTSENNLSDDFTPTKNPNTYRSLYYTGKEAIRLVTDGKLSKPGRVIIHQGDNKKIQNQIVFSSMTAKVTTGFLRSDREGVDSILRQAKNVFVRNELEQIGGANCYVIEGTKANGKYTLWIDPKHGYNLAKVMVRKPDLLYCVKNVRFEKTDDVWIPVEADIQQDTYLPKGDFAKSEMHYKQTEIILNPDHDAMGSFVPDDIMNGARVHVIGLKDEYKWQDGQVVDEKGRVILDCRPKKPRRNLQNLHLLNLEGLVLTAACTVFTP